MHELEIKHNRRLQSARPCLFIAVVRSLPPRKKVSWMPIARCLINRPRRRTDATRCLPRQPFLPPSFSLALSFWLYLERAARGPADSAKGIISQLSSFQDALPARRAASDCRTQCAWIEKVLEMCSQHF